MDSDLKHWLQRNLETFTYGDENAPYVDVAELAARLGLDWQAVRADLTRDDHWGFREETATDKESRTRVVCGLPAEKVMFFLRRLDPAQVRPELRTAFTEYRRVSDEMTRQAFLKSDLLEYAEGKEDPSPLERLLVEAAQSLRDQGYAARED